MRALDARVGERGCLEFMHRLCESNRKCRAHHRVKPCCGSISHRLENDPFGTLAVPLAIEDSLPRPEIELSGRDRYDDLVADGDRAEMRRGVVLARAAVVAVSLGVPRRDGLLEPIEDVLPESRLVVVHEYGGRDMHRRGEHHPLAD